MTGVLMALVVLGIIIVVHELGHFLVAKFFKIKVETFSVGFGPRLIGYKYGETDYRISALPLGGYVKMSGENPGDTITGDPREFMSKPKWQRFFVAAAGPIMNIILAVVLLTALFMHGSEVAAFMKDMAVVGSVDAGSPAEQAGLRAGDRIVALDGRTNPAWPDVDSRIAINSKQPLPITVERDGQRIDLVLTPIHKESIARGYAGIGPPTAVVVVDVHAGKPAEKAGIQKGDEIIAVNGLELRSQKMGFPELLQGIKDKTFPIQVKRNGELQEFPVTPVFDEKTKKQIIGIGIGNVVRPGMPAIKLGFVDALSLSIDKNVENAGLILTVLGKLFKPIDSGGVPLNTLEGPLGIIRHSGDAARMGVGATLMLMATISLNLGLLNLMPIPILDGGVMLLILIEGLMRRELSLRVKERIVQVSFVALLMLTAFVLYYDVVKLLPSPTANP